MRILKLYFTISLPATHCNFVSNICEEINTPAAFFYFCFYLVPKEHIHNSSFTVITSAAYQRQPWTHVRAAKN